MLTRRMLCTASTILVAVALLSSLAVVHAQPGEPFAPPPTLTPVVTEKQITIKADGTPNSTDTVKTLVTHTFELRYDVTSLSQPVAGFPVRTYQTEARTMVGPTIRVKAGHRLVIKLYNDLMPIDSLPKPVVDEDGNEDLSAVISDKRWNQLHGVNITNLHVHGMHVDPNGEADNIFVSINGGDMHTYVYDIPYDHPRGTYWYHPHYHGSAAYQVSSGAAGMLIVEDDGVTVNQDAKPVLHPTHGIGAGTDPDTGKPFTAVTKLYGRDTGDVKRDFEVPIVLQNLMLFDTRLQTNRWDGDYGLFSMANEIYDEVLLSAGYLQVNTQPPQPPAAGVSLTPPFVEPGINGTPLKASPMATAMPPSGKHPDRPADDVHDWVTVNGNVQPKMPMRSNVYYRFRIVNAMSSRQVVWELRYRDTEAEQTAIAGGVNRGSLYIGEEEKHRRRINCTMQAVAHDGVYRKDPILVDHALVVSGARVDMMLLCHATEVADITVSDPRGLVEIWSVNDGRYTGGSPEKATAVHAHLMTLDVSLTSPPSELLLSQYLNLNKTAVQYPLPRRPAFMASDFPMDRAAEIVADESTFELAMSPGYQINRAIFTGSVSTILPLDDTTRGEEIETFWLVKGTAGRALHPFHLHVNHFQLYAQGDDALPTQAMWAPLYNQWIDTSPLGGQQLIMRIVPRDFVGRSVFHCHSLYHEDRGMMMQFDIRRQTPKTIQSTAPVPCQAPSTCCPRPIVGLDSDYTRVAPRDNTVEWAAKCDSTNVGDECVYRCADGRQYLINDPDVAAEVAEAAAADPSAPARATPDSAYRTLTCMAGGVWDYADSIATDDDRKLWLQDNSCRTIRTQTTSPATRVGGVVTTMAATSMALFVAWSAVLAVALAVGM